MSLHNLIFSLGVAPVSPGDLSPGNIVFLYLGPETTLPLASALAAVIGFVLIFWRRALGIASRAFRSFRHKDPPRSAGEINLESRDPGGDIQE